MGCVTNPTHREVPVRRPYDSPAAVLGQPGWARWLADALGLDDYSAAVTRALLARCLLLAAAVGAAVSAVARRLGVGRETARKGLAAALPATAADLENRLARGLHRRLPRAVLRRRVPIAVDLHLRPYYGGRDTPGICGGKPDRGARWFWGYATAVLLRPGPRHTVALTAVGRGEAMAAVLERVLAQVGWSGVRVRYVRLDRGFYAAAVVNALRRRGLRFVVPVPRRGRAVDRFFRRGARGWFDHTIRCKAARADSAAVRVAVVPGPDGRRPQVFACSPGFRALARVALRYQRRFGIETSYRQLGECLARTTSRDARYRLLLVGVALLIRSWWVADGRVRLLDIRLAIILGVVSPAAGGRSAGETEPEASPEQRSAP